MLKLANLFTNRDGILKLVIRVGLALVLFAPIIIYNDSYFPFVFPRNIFFRLIIDIIFPLYLWLVVRNVCRWPKLNKGFIFFILFILTLTISSIFGGHFIFSFWSTFERMDGLVNWYHILMYVIVLLGFNQQEEDWSFLFKTSLLVSWIVALYALGQSMGLNFLMASSDGQRLSSLLGNAAYVGSYLFLHIVIASYLILNNIQKRNYFSIGSFYYALSIILFIIILLATETRGAFLGLASFVFILVLAYLYFERRNKNLFYSLVVGLLLLSFVAIGLIFTQKNSTWVKAVPIFSRFANISLKDTTTQSRLFIWKNSILYSFKEKPLIGWGEENFSDAFNKYFPTDIFVKMNSEVWYDRPHNALIQHLVQSGIIGFSFYIGIFIYLLVILNRLRKDNNNWLRQALWSAFLLSFLVQDFFIFDNLNVNVIFYLILAYLFYLANQSTKNKIPIPGPTAWEKSFTQNRINLISRAILLTLLSISLIYFMIWKPWQSNIIFVKTFFYAPRAVSQEDFKKIKNDWLKSYYLVPLGEKEKVAALNDLLGLIVGNYNATDDIRFEFINLTGQYLEANYEKYPMDIRSGIFVSNFYQFIGSFDKSFIDQDIALLERMAILAPNRLEIKYGLMYDFIKKGDLAKAKEQAVLARDLAPNSRDVYWKMAEIYWLTRDYVEFKANVEKVRTWNNDRGFDEFDQSQLTDLQVYLKQANDEKNHEAIAIVENFLKK